MPEQEPVSPTAQDTLALLEKACSTALAMTGRLPASPSSLRVAAGDVAVELHWNGTSPLAAGDRNGPAVAGNGNSPPVAGNGDSPPAAGNGHAAGVESAQPPGAEESDQLLVRAPAVGVYYQAPQPGASPFVRTGTVVQPGQRVAIIEAMKVMIPVAADRPGRVTQLLVSDGDAVEYDAPLLVLEPLAD
jgi:acetyl-CoA carboxylase biotin carboxyl carrier protein